MTRRLGHFEILEEIGSGGMGTVYRARDRNLRRTVAVKTLPPASRDDLRRGRLFAEARAASALNHPAIVTIHEVGSDADVDYIAMELVEGRNLGQVLEDGPLDDERVRGYAIILAEALAVAHRAGVIHRDLKPSNVMVMPTGALKILDFGLAKRLAVEPETDPDASTLTEVVRTADGTLLGTPAYMSPEQARGLPADHRSDLFSLGSMLYEMLTGHRPFSGTGPMDVLSAILRDEPEPPSKRRRSVSPSWDPIVARLLAKDPAGRYASAEQLLADLRRPGGPTPISRPVTRRMVWIVVGAIILSLVVAGALWLGSEATARRTVDTGVSPAGFPEYRFRLAADLPGPQRQPSLSPDGRMVAFVMPDAADVDQIWVMDLSGGAPLQVTATGSDAGAPNWSASGRRIVFHVADDGIWAVPPLGGDAHRLVDSGIFPVSSPDDSRIAYNDQRRIWLADGDGRNARPLDSIPPSHFGGFALPAFSPDGTRLVTFLARPERPLGDLWIAPVDGSPPRQLTELHFLSWGTAPVWTADGEWILFSSDHGGSVNLWRVPATGGSPQPVTYGAGSDFSPDIASDLSRLIYANGRNTARVEVFRPRAGTVRTGYERRYLAITPELSHAGDRIAFFSRGKGGFQLFVADLATGEARQVTHQEDAINTHPVWSADDRMLYYYQQEPDVAFRLVSVDGRHDETLIDDWRWPVQHQTHLSPDGTRVVYLLRAAGKNLEARVRLLEDGEEHGLPLPLYDPRWTPDGREIFGATWEPDRVHFCAADGTRCRDVTAGWQARLSADGATLYVLRDSPPVVWRHDLATGEEERLIAIEAYDHVDFGWGVAPNGDVVYHTQHTEQEELWMGEAAGRDGGE